MYRNPTSDSRSAACSLLFFRSGTAAVVVGGQWLPVAPSRNYRSIVRGSKLQDAPRVQAPALRQHAIRIGDRTLRCHDRHRAAVNELVEALSEVDEIVGGRAEHLWSVGNQASQSGMYQVVVCESGGRVEHLIAPDLPILQRHTEHMTAQCHRTFAIDTLRRVERANGANDGLGQVCLAQAVRAQVVTWA